MGKLFAVEKHALGDGVIDPFADEKLTRGGPVAAGGGYAEQSNKLTPDLLSKAQLAAARAFYAKHQGMLPPDRIKQLQDKLKMKSTGVMDHMTIQAVARHQKSLSETVSGIVTAELLGDLIGKAGTGLDADGLDVEGKADAAMKRLSEEADKATIPGANAKVTFPAYRVKRGKRWYRSKRKEYPEYVIGQIRDKLGLGEGGADGTLVKAVAAFQKANGFKKKQVDGLAGPGTLRAMFGKDIRELKGRMKGHSGKNDPTYYKSKQGRGKYAHLKEHRIDPKVFGEPTPAELVKVEGKYLHVLAAPSFRAMQAAAVADGIPAHHMKLNSGYRSIQSQKGTLEANIRLLMDREKNPLSRAAATKKVKNRTVAEPGRSPHHTGLAVDITVPGIGKAGRPSKGSKAYAWLAENAANFGFYPLLFEGWHWEFNPAGMKDTVKAYREGIFEDRRKLKEKHKEGQLNTSESAG